MARKLGRLLFSFRGRITRSTFWTGVLSIGFVFVVLLTFLETALGRRSSLVLYPFLLWSLASLAVRRLHDRGRSPAWLLVLLIPLLGPLLAAFELGFRPGTPGENHYAPDPRDAGADYFTVKTPGGQGEARQVVNDVTQLNPVSVFAVATPTTVEEVQDAVRRSTGALSVGGGHFSMGGQTASPGSLHADLRPRNNGH